MQRRLSMLFVVSGASACAHSATFPGEHPTSHICVVRHAEAYKNLSPPPADMSPDELDALTPAGWDRARELGERAPRPVSELWASPTQRTQQTAAGMGLSAPVKVEPGLRPLEGDLSWNERETAWAEGKDPRPEGGESLADGAARARALLDRLQAELLPAEHAVLVTHGDIAPILIGELRGTPLLERPRRDHLDTGEMVCLPLGSSRPDAAE